MNETNSQLAQIAINPTKYGASFNGSDDTQAIKQALIEAATKGNSEVMLSGVVGITEVIEIPQGVTLNSYNATIKPLVNTNVISFNRNTKIKGTLLIDVSHLAENFTSSVLYLDGSKRLSYRDISTDDIFIFGHAARGMGKAIHLDCGVEQSDISFVNFGRVVIRGFEYGVHLDAPALSGVTLSNYINGNIFKDLTISDCDYYIYGSGDHSGNGRNQVDGNGFLNTQLQYNSRAKQMVHFEGWNNYLKGFAWDSTGKDVLVANLTQSSRGNNIEIFGSSSKYLYEDKGINNYIHALDFDNDVIPLKTPYANAPSYVNSYLGDYEDIFHSAEKLHEVSIIEGESLISGGIIDSIFNSDSRSDLRLNLLENNRFTIKLNFDGTVYPNQTTEYLYGGLKVLGLSFSDSRKPKEVNIKVISNTGEEHSTVIDMLERRDYGVTIRRNTINGLNKNIKSIEITLVGQVGADVRLSRIFASSYYIGGNRFMSNNGMLTGTLDAEKGQIKIEQVGVLPIPTAAHKRRIVYFENTSQSDQAGVFVCVKNNDGSHEWKRLDA